MLVLLQNIYDNITTLQLYLLLHSIRISTEVKEYNRLKTINVNSKHGADKHPSYPRGNQDPHSDCNALLIN